MSEYLKNIVNYWLFRKRFYLKKKVLVISQRRQHFDLYRLEVFDCSSVYWFLKNSENPLSRQSVSSH